MSGMTLKDGPRKHTGKNGKVYYGPYDNSDSNKKKKEGGKDRKQYVEYDKSEKKVTETTSAARHDYESKHGNLSRSQHVAHEHGADKSQGKHGVHAESGHKNIGDGNRDRKKKRRKRR